MTTQAAEFRTAEQIRAEAAAEYEAANPRPTPPTPPVIERPIVIQMGDAHAWLDVTTDQAHYRASSEAQVKFFIVHRYHDKDQRIEGVIDAANLEALLEELVRVGNKVVARTKYLTQNEEHSEQSRMWTNAKDEFTRQRVAEWERAKKADGKK
jgi:hypothetical protein